MCDTSDEGGHDRREGRRSDHRDLVVPVNLDAFIGERIPRQPVERISVTTLVDNVCDVLTADDGPARRPPTRIWPRQPSPIFEEGSVVDGPRAEHGFSPLVEVQLTSGAVHQLILDTGVSPDGMIENMRRLQFSGRR